MSNSASVGELKAAAPHEEDDRSNRGVTFVVPVNSSTTFQSTRHLSTVTTAAVGNHGNCTSVFIDVVEWLSPLVTGQLEGKVSSSNCYIIYSLILTSSVSSDTMSKMFRKIGLIQLVR